MSTRLTDQASLLRIYVGERDKYKGKPLFEWLVLKAKEAGIAGATVLRSPLGYGHSSQVHNATILRLSTDLPMIVEIIDDEEKLRAFVNDIRPAVKGTLVTIEKLTIIPTGQWEEGDQH